MSAPGLNDLTSVLDHESRRTLWALVQRYPGDSGADLRARADLARTTFRSHVDKLMEADLVREVARGRSCHYFPVGDDEELRSVLVVARNAERVAVLRGLAREPQISWTELADRLDVSGRTIRYHVEKLEQSGLVRVEGEGESHRVRLAEEAAYLVPDVAEPLLIEDPSARPSLSR